MTREKTEAGKEGNMNQGIGIRYHKIWTVLFCFLALAALAVWAPNANAFQTVANCSGCHSFGNSSSTFHQGHLNLGLPQSCNTCHVQTGDTPNTSRCGECHVAPGLPRHHQTAQVPGTSCTSCHSGTPDPENTPVPGYATTTVDLNPCNGSEERFTSLTISLDNDGDGLYDMEDPDCQTTPANTPVSVRSAKSGAPGSAITFTATATDPDAGQTLTFSLTGAPAGATIDSSTGAFSWTPTTAGPSR